MKIGMHTGQQDCSFDELRRVWHIADDNGYSWVSIWDHFYEAPYVDGGSLTYETVSALAALASETKNVRVGVLVFSAGYRPPALMAKMITTIDHISNGRANLGMGAGWHVNEYEAYGYQFPGPKTRLDMLEESVQIIQGMLRDGRTTFKGKHFSAADAQLVPGPMQAKLPVWIGGQGEKRTIPMAARYADGYNAAYIPPELFKRKIEVLDRSCEALGRDPAEIERSINSGFYMGVNEEDAGRHRETFYQQWGRRAEHIEGGMLLGTAQEAIDRIGRFSEAGAQGLNIAFRPPFDWDAIQAFTEDVLPVFS